MINDTLHISTNILPNTQKTAEDRGRDQTLVHFESIERVSESEFRGSIDPIVVYRKKGEQEQVNVQPFNYDNPEKENLSFETKLQHFSKTTRDLRTNVIKSEQLPNLVSISIDSYDLGTVNDFYVALTSPTDMGILYDRFFGSVFIEMSQEDLNDFQNGLGE